MDPFGLFGMDDIYGFIYDATGGYSPSQGLVNGVAGFRDGAYQAITLGIGNLQDVRDAIGAGVCRSMLQSVQRLTHCWKNRGGRCAGWGTWREIVCCRGLAECQSILQDRVRQE
jgi:hypothetical protein